MLPRILMRRIAILSLVSIVSGCESIPSVNEQRRQAVEYAPAPFVGDAIRIDMTATPQLNTFNHLPNSCTVLVVQAQRREQLEGILGNAVLLRNLFAQAGGIEGVLKLDSYVMMPGQRVSLHIDRAEQTRYVALIAGYYPAPNESQTRIFAIPAKLTSQGIFSKQWQASLIPLNIAVTLGRESIVFSNKMSGQRGDDIVLLSQPTVAVEENASLTESAQRSIRETGTSLG
ncbi:type VI secretion lipoprotein TssJ [Salmonella enterica]|nr:type VI secretion lipoprotein TssJ [Salmonella enterica]